MKVEKLEKFQNKMGLKGCKWSSLIAPGTETPQSYPYLERKIGTGGIWWSPKVFFKIYLSFKPGQKFPVGLY